MRVLVVEAGGVGAAVASVALRRDFFERMVFADWALSDPTPSRRNRFSTSLRITARRTESRIGRFSA
jgi:hypothetical protein